MPVAAFAEVTRDGGQGLVRLRGRVVALAGDAAVDGERVGPAATPVEAEALGKALAEQLLGEGAEAILRSVRVGRAEAVPEP